MARVPYSAVPEVSPTMRGIPTARLDTPVAAFGGASAEATRGLGRAMEGAGNELFTRALAMQQMANTTEANDATTNFMIESGKLHADFGSLRGKAAVDAYPKYQSDLQDLQRKIGSGLSNPMSQRLYNQESRSTMARTIFNGAGHAASENKQWALGSSKARVQALGDQAQSLGQDDVGFQRTIQQIQNEVSQQGQLLGWDKDQTDQEMARRISNQHILRIEGLARTNPASAQKMLDKSLADGAIRGEEQSKVVDFVQTRMRSTGARLAANQIRSGADNYWGSQAVPIARAKAAIGGYESGNDYSKVGPSTAHGRALGRYQVMEEFLPDYLRRAGLGSMTPEQFLKDPKAQDAIFEAAFGGDMQKYGSFNEAASRWFTGRSVADAKAAGAKDVLGTKVDDYLRNTNAILARETPLADKVARGRELAKQQSPDDPLFGDYVQQRVEADHSQDMRVRINDEYSNRQVLADALMGGKTGKLPTNLDELFANNPDAEQAWTNLPATRRQSFMRAMAQNAKGEVTWTDEGLRRYQTLKGMAATNPTDFLDTDVISEHLPNSAKRELINLQGRLKDKAEGDPRVRHALEMLGPTLQAAGISAKDRDDYFKFVGTLQDALEGFSQENKRPPKADEIRTIGNRLLQQQVYSPGMLWDSKDSLFRFPVPSDADEAIRKDPAWTSLGITPTDEQVQRIYVRSQYQKLYGKK